MASWRIWVDSSGTFSITISTQCRAPPMGSLCSRAPGWARKAWSDLHCKLKSPPHKLPSSPFLSQVLLPDKTLPSWCHLCLLLGETKLQRISHLSKGCSYLGQFKGTSRNLFLRSHLNERILKTTELINLPDPMSYYKLIRVVSLNFVLPGSRAHMVTEKVLNDCWLYVYLWMNKPCIKIHVIYQHFNQSL